ncbi:LLM class flavin-dependent oxidoreductase [Bradyrhizobium sp. WSM2793]|uniref:LLM class flavin-dependent oxidoreductase n=1 Tax=Bradyrhizobium sp. WSM2793 TaxID=1038866 RepID=UPI0003A6ACD4|nr:LLM class flavin-dependent oxidoreductase [Bradyrhizobium sp. WSM2793]
MSKHKRMMKLGINLVSNGGHNSGWRHPKADPAVANNFEAYANVVRAAEEQKLHFMFVADGAAVRIRHKNAEELSYHGHIDRFEPLTLLSALAAVTKHIGLICTAATTYNAPYVLARKFASLDHISHGRAGWNVVTGWSEEEAMNFGKDMLVEHSERYKRAAEFVGLVKGLWDSWADDAFVRDKEEGRYFHPERLRILNHSGEFYKVRGPLNIERPPQGYPVIAQAGGSGPGRELGAATADIIYTGQKDVRIAREFYSDMKSRIGGAGRNPDKVFIMPGIMPILGDTREQADEEIALLNAAVHPRVGMQYIADIFGDLSAYEPDDYMPLPLPPANGVKSAREQWERRLRETPMTIRQVYESITMSAGHLMIGGTVETVADAMQEWFETGACDGWNLLAAYLPGSAYEHLSKLVPELRRRGVFRSEYEGATLRENLGLSKPSNQFFGEPSARQK